MLVAGADQGQPALLRAIVDQRLTEQHAPQVFGQRLAHAHGEDAGLFERMIDHRRAIASREDQRVSFRLQGIEHADEALSLIHI